MVVDDDREDADFLVWAIDRRIPGCRYVIYEDARAAIDFLTTFRDADKQDCCPHIVFLDLVMPRTDGLQMLSEIRAMDHLSSLILVVLSTSLSDRSKERCRILGSDAIYIKPWSLEDYEVIAAESMELIRGRGLREFQ